MSQQKETLFKSRVRRRLDEIPNSFWIKTQMLSLRGCPDILGVYKGKFIALELKVGPNKADALQLWNLDKITQNGGFARIVKPENLDAVMAEIRAL